MTVTWQQFHICRKPTVSIVELLSICRIVVEGYVLKDTQRYSKVLTTLPYEETRTDCIMFRASGRGGGEKFNQGS